MTERVISQQINVEQENLFLPGNAHDPDQSQPERPTSEVIILGEDSYKVSTEDERSYVDKLGEQIAIHQEQLDFFLTQRAKNVILEQAFQPKASTEHISVTDFVASGLGDLLRHEEESHDKMADKIKGVVIPKANRTTGPKNDTADYRTNDIPMLNIYAEAHHLMAGLARSKYQEITDNEGTVSSPTHYLAQKHMKDALEPAVLETHDAFDTRVAEIKRQKAVKAKQIMTVTVFINQGAATDYLVGRVGELEADIVALDSDLAVLEKEKTSVFARLLKIQAEIQQGTALYEHEGEFSDYQYSKAA